VSITDVDPIFVEVPAPMDEALQAQLHMIIARPMKLVACWGVLAEEASVKLPGLKRRQLGRRPCAQAAVSCGLHLLGRLRPT
jgi:hypothetical protein